MRKGRINNNVDSNNSVKSEENFSKSLKIVKSHKDKLQKERENRKNSINKEEISDKYKKVRPFVLTIIFILILSLICVLFYFGPVVGISLNRNIGIDEDKRIDVASSDSDIYESYCSDLLIYNNQKVTTYNNRGKKTWEYNIVEQFTPNIYIKGNFMAISNNTSGKIYLFENKKEILNTKIEGQIDEIFLDDNGNMAIEYSTSGYKKIIGVYSKKGKNLYNAYMSSNSITDIKLLDNAKKLLVIQTNTNSFKVGLDLSIVNGTQEKQIKELATIDNNFIYDLTIQGQDIIMLLDDKILKCNMDTGDVETIYSFDSNQIMFLSLSNNYYTIISKSLNTNMEDSNYSIVSNRFDNTKISELPLEESPKLLNNNNLINYLVYQDKLQAINKWGVEIKKIDMDFPPKDTVVFNNSKSIALIYSNKIYIVNV